MGTNNPINPVLLNGKDKKPAMTSTAESSHEINENFSQSAQRDMQATHDANLWRTSPPRSGSHQKHQQHQSIPPLPATSTTTPETTTTQDGFDTKDNEVSNPTTSTTTSIIPGTTCTETYVIPQQAIFLNDKLITACWNGSYQVYEIDSSSLFKLIYTGKSESSIGIQMMVPCGTDGTQFIVSNNKQSLQLVSLITVAAGTTHSTYETIPYDERLGVANSGLWLSNTQLVIGHETGYISLFNISKSSRLEYEVSWDISSRNPIKSPYPMKNIRSIQLSPYTSDTIITGSEDGDVVVFNIKTGTEITRTRYFHNATVGINSMVVDASSKSLLIGTCAEKGRPIVWLFELTGDHHIKQLDFCILTNKITNTPLTTAFSVILTRVESKLLFYISTLDGLLFYGDIDESSYRMNPKGQHKFQHQASPVLALRDGMLAVVGENMHLVKLM